MKNENSDTHPHYSSLICCVMALTRVYGGAHIEECRIMAEGIEGRRVNSQLFVYDGYIYRKNTSCRNGNKYYFTCTRKSCPARAIKTGDAFKVTKEHNHLVSVEEKEELAFKASCKRKAQESTMDLRKIFEEECARFPEGSRRVTFASFQSTMQKVRHTNRLPIHKTLGEFGKLITSSKSHTLTTDASPDNRQLFYRGMLREGCITILVFASETMTRDALKNARHVYMDSFSKFLPDAFKHVFTIHAEAFNYVFPCMYALMSHKSKEAYNLLFKFVNENFCPELCPCCIVTDFEPELQAAVLQYYPHAKHWESWYYYVQAIWQYVIQHKLTPLIEKHLPTKRVFKFLLTLPLLPPNRLQEGFHFVKRFAEEENVMQRSISNFFAYFNRHWMVQVGHQRLSVHGQNRRTNNFLGVFHSTIVKCIGHHQQNLWKFLEGLQHIDLFERQYYNHLVTNPVTAVTAKFTQKSRPKTMLDNPAVKQATEKISSGTLTVREFLMGTCHVMVESLSTEIQAALREEADAGLPDEDEQKDLLEAEAAFHLDHDYAANFKRVTHEQPNLPFILQTESRELAPFVLKEEQLSEPLQDSVIVNFVDTQVQDAACGDNLDSIVLSSCEEIQQQSCSVNMQCVCCLTNVKTVLFLPCTHLCCCQSCANEVHLSENNRRCPLCQIPYTRKIVALL